MAARRKNSKAKPRGNAEKGLPPYDPKAPRKTHPKLPIVGRPPAYDPEFDERYRKLCLLGLTMEECAFHFGVSVNTLLQWEAKHPSFKLSREEGGEKADAEIAEALRRRGLGYSHPAEKIMLGPGGQVIREEYIQHYPPDTKAMELWLTNRRGKNWKTTRAAEKDEEVIRIIREAKPPPKQE